MSDFQLGTEQALLETNIKDAENYIKMLTDLGGDWTKEEIEKQKENIETNKKHLESVLNKLGDKKIKYRPKK